MVIGLLNTTLKLKCRVKWQRESKDKLHILNKTEGMKSQGDAYPGGCAQSSCLTGVDTLCSPLVALCQEHNHIYTHTYIHTERLAERGGHRGKLKWQSAEKGSTLPHC